MKCRFLNPIASSIQASRAPWAAVVLFGASTPLAKLLLGQMHPVTLAGVLYLGSNVGLLAGWALRRTWSTVPPWHEAGLDRHDIRWLVGAIVTGGVMGPVLLMVGLTLTLASSASLLLNLEGVLTAVLAWFALHGNFDRRICGG
jgi:drug/metabolite transporter (DMT)-like permease